MIIMYEIQKIDGPVVAHITSTKNKKELEAFGHRINNNGGIEEPNGSQPFTLSVNGYKRRLAHKRGAKLVTEEEFYEKGVKSNGRT